jgi:hypothetical protein
VDERRFALSLIEKVSVAGVDTSSRAPIQLRAGQLRAELIFRDAVNRSGRSAPKRTWGDRAKCAKAYGAMPTMWRARPARRAGPAESGT